MVAARSAAALALLAALAAIVEAHATPPGTTLHSNTTNRMNGGAGQDASLCSLGHTESVEECAARCVAWEPASGPAQRCRSFTRFADSYHSNVSLSGACFGRLDPSWVPLQATGDDAADSGTVDWPCSGATEVSSLDCSLNGRCVQGACVCSKGWKGRRCEALNLAPVNASVLGFNPTAGGTNMSSWGASVQQVGGVWHMWAVLLTNHCGILSYLLNSAVVHAISTRGATGPYVQKETVLPPFAHEPDVVRAPTGELVLITVAGDLGGFSSCQCSDGITSECNVCNNSCHSQAPTLSVAASPTGPWATRPVGPDWRGENPSIWITRNGTLLGMSRGGRISAYATNWSDLSTWTHALPNAGPMQGELPTRPDAE